MEKEERLEIRGSIYTVGKGGKSGNKAGKVRGRRKSGKDAKERWEGEKGVLSQDIRLGPWEEMVGAGVKT